MKSQEGINLIKMIYLIKHEQKNVIDMEGGYEHWEAYARAHIWIGCGIIVIKLC